ncbi:hypothetical protein N7468_009588 [Penicillium chermesinum]|uniref:SHSP domain-containing protein n=1 Tax=Penicillium chermesinum TaxID=63820 RepID=A0A9W9TFD9_9EURO|nr:uncharacterized protein N7468_009588 [Penicillium chermesinum]KAJ5220384.1 hypothetical protein N7468_009588 [Penicillium chermesinum]KAJ6157823.1 hypothetical protein N7470_005415 [Penicillium chermesinum]
MSLFRANFPGQGDFAPLFRLLDDYDTHRNTRTRATPSFSPSFDVRETDDSYHLDGELPGVAQKDVDIEFSDHQTLVVKGRVEREYHSEPQAESGHKATVEDEGSSKEVEKKDKAQPKHRYWAHERSVGEFQRTFTFPSRVDQDAVKASLKNGILSIVVPKSNGAASKKITIE